MAIQINGVAVPASIVSRGIYKYNAPAIIGYNGQGDLITAGYAVVEWTFSTMTATEFAYWETTLLTGLPSKRMTNNRLWDRLMAETPYSELVLERPEFENYNGNRYRNVAIRMTQVIP